VAEYRIVDRIGQGGMGIVYRAVQETRDRPVAIKILPSSLMTSGTAIPRFLREIQACTQLTHPNIIRILDSGEISGQPFYAMELLEAHTLREMLADNGPLPIGQVIEIFKQMLEALGYCHNEGLIHRDVKPHNIMVDHLNHATLMDFGLVKMLERSGITHSKRIVGSPNYMCPEMLQGADITSQADLWSLGCVIYELLTGERAFPGKAIRDIGSKILKEDPAPVPDRRPDCPIGLAQIVSGLLKKVPADRYFRAEHVLRDLARVEAGRPPLGPFGAAQGESSPAVMRDLALEAAPEPEPDARQFRRAARRTRAAPAVSTIVALPQEVLKVPRRMRLRALLPQTWKERLFVAAVLVIGVLSLIALTLAQVRARDPDGAALVADIRVERALDAFELSWTSAEPYRGAVRFTRSGAAESSESVELTARRDHRVRVAGLAAGASYDVAVAHGARVLWRSSVTTLAPLDLAMQLEAALAVLDAPGLARRLEDDLFAIPVKERKAAGPRMEEVRARFGKLIGEKLAAVDLAGALARFIAVRHDVMLSPAVPANKKRSLWMALEGLEDLRLLASAAGVTPAPPHAVDQSRGAGYGPVADFTIVGGTETAVVPVKKGDARDDPGVFFTELGTPDRHLMGVGDQLNFRDFYARLEYRHPSLVNLAGGCGALEVGLSATQLAPLSRVVLWLGTSEDTLLPVAVFRGPHDKLARTVVALDPRLADGDRIFKLEFKTSRALTPDGQQSTQVRDVVFRCGRAK
jgi:hypothetical protein